MKHRVPGTLIAVSFLALAVVAAGAPPAVAAARGAPLTTPAAPRFAMPGNAPAPQAQAGTRPNGNAQQGKTVFDQKCGSCHSIGGGRRVGPDLKGINALRPQDWLVRFISEPDKVIASNDPTAQALVKEYGSPMPNVGVNQQQAVDILTYIFDQSGGQAPPAAGGAQTAPAAQGNATNGRALFSGEKPLANGGPACIGCHNVQGEGALGGGNWGLDLTYAQTKLGAAGLAPILKSPPFPGMTEAYASHPITDSEAADLLAFFAQVDGQQAGGTPGFVFPLIALGAFLVLLILTRTAWRSRLVGVRDELVSGGE